MAMSCNLKCTKTSLRKADVKTLIEILTENCLIGTHAERMDHNFYDFCRSCQQLEEEENIEHLLCHRSAYILSNLCDTAATDIRAILKFVLRSKWFFYEELEELRASIW